MNNNNFRRDAHQSGIEAATKSAEMSRTKDEVSRAKTDTELRIRDIRKIGPAPIKAAGLREWYSGPLDDDQCWAELRAFLKYEKGRLDAEVDSINNSSNSVIAHTPRPGQANFTGRGLVVGRVQSGKTTNFTAVAAKAADLGYKLIIVFSGIHNSLRKQTQDRLQHELLDSTPGKWINLTTSKEDFKPPRADKEQRFLHGPNTGIMVTKKNKDVLERLTEWIESESVQKHATSIRTLIIDDEADQASVATKRINPQIQRLLHALPRCTYIGYTATPFANVFIQPSYTEDLYPKDFILALPTPDNYFGPEQLFGDSTPENELDARGRDMIRSIPPEQLRNLRPERNSENGTFIPDVTGSLAEAIDWFLLATTAKRLRKGNGHASMLIHTHISTDVHESFREPVMNYIMAIKEKVEHNDISTIARLEQQWNTETNRVPATSWGHETNAFAQIVGALPATALATRVIIDNYKSRDRLDYAEANKAGEPLYAIAIGANTLSRGLTLEGLVSTVFVRTSGAYDTLLQMGRWFGFRPGYEDLPRIWMTDELQDQYRHLSQVEQEMREEIEQYQRLDITPMQLGVRILRHPTLAITGKMGAAKTFDLNYVGTRVTTKHYRVGKDSPNDKNLDATRELIRSIGKYEKPSREQGSEYIVFDDVPADHIFKFFREYRAAAENPDVSTQTLTNFIRLCHNNTRNYLRNWTIVVVGGEGNRFDIGYSRNLASLVRRGRRVTESAAYIKTLPNPTDFGLGTGLTRKELTTATAGKPSDLALLAMRGKTQGVAEKGLLMIYPIDPARILPSPRSTRHAGLASEFPPDLPIIGIGVGFPDPGLSGSPLPDFGFRTSYSAVVPAESFEEERYEIDPVLHDLEDYDD